jgi:hypothetical protein
MKGRTIKRIVRATVNIIGIITAPLWMGFLLWVMVLLAVWDWEGTNLKEILSGEDWLLK